MRGPALLPLLGVTLLALVAVGCSNLSGDRAQQVQEWYDAAGYAANAAQLQSDLGFVARAARARDLGALKTDCLGDLGNDPEAIYGTLPTPDKALTSDLSTMWQQLTAAAGDCIAATSFDSPHFRRYEREVAAGSAAFRAANKRFADLHVR